MEENQMNLILGIGPEIQFSEEVKKTLRVGTIKQIREITELYKDGLLKIKALIHRQDDMESQITKWIDILNLILIEGFTREEFDNSIPELMERAVDQFLFS